MNFYCINSQKDIDFLMESFGYFHDSCIKEIKYVSGGYVELNHSMYPFNSLRTINIIFQSQNAPMPVIEMQFDLINRMNLEPRDENYDCIIYSASLVKINNIYYWSEWNDFKVADIENGYGTWISSQKIKWRPLTKAIGKEIIYGYIQNPI